jgi:hypothetical protein
VKLVGPDTEGYYPSDLAEMGRSHEELAKWIARAETELTGVVSLMGFPSYC